MADLSPNLTGQSWNLSSLQLHCTEGRGVTAVLASQAAHSRSAMIVVERQLVVEQGRDTTTMHYMSSLTLLAVSVPLPILGT